MSQGLADTSLFIAKRTGRAVAKGALPDELAIITIGELRAGVRAATDTQVRVRRLKTLTDALRLDPVPIDDAVAERWAALRVLLRDHALRLPVNASWIAATAMSLGVPVVTQDSDFPELPGLDVVLITSKDQPGSFREHVVQPFPGGMSPPSWPLIQAENDMVGQLQAALQ